MAYFVGKATDLKVEPRPDATLDQLQKEIEEKRNAER